MRTLVFAFAASGMLISATPIASAADVESLPGDGAGRQAYSEQCLKDLQTFDKKLAEVGFGVLPPSGYGASAPSGYYFWGVEATPREKIRSLRAAAFVYAISGNEHSCQMVLASMRQVYKDHQKLVDTETDDPEVRRAWRRAHLSRARPVQQMDHLMRADVLIGSEIRNLNDEELGKIEDIVLNPEKGDILYVLASRGGFLGIGEQLFAIPWRELRATEDHEIYVLDVPTEALDDAPRVNRGNFEKTADAAWRRSLSAYWEGVQKQ